MTRVSLVGCLVALALGVGGTARAQDIDWTAPFEDAAAPGTSGSPECVRQTSTPTARPLTPAELAALGPRSTTPVRPPATEVLPPAPAARVPERSVPDRNVPEQAAELTPNPRQPSSPCPAPVLVTRGYSSEGESLQLTTCSGHPNLAVLDALSILARPRNTEVPPEDQRTDGEDLAPDIRRLDPGLLTRLQAIASRFPDQAIVIVSGYRPSPTSRSRHAHARAVDIQVTGTTRWEVASFARSLSDTGVGYYPNSLFTHIDVREGEVAWMDRSGPGEPSDYAAWPDGPVESELAETSAEESTDAESTEVPSPTADEVRRRLDESLDRADETLGETELSL